MGDDEGDSFTFEYVILQYIKNIYILGSRHGIGPVRMSPFLQSKFQD